VAHTAGCYLKQFGNLFLIVFYQWLILFSSIHRSIFNDHFPSFVALACGPEGFEQNPVDIGRMVFLQTGLFS